MVINLNGNTISAAYHKNIGAVIAALGLKPGDFVGLTAGKKLVAQKTSFS